MKQYPIHVVSKLLGISPQGLKFFEKYGLTPFKRSKNGYRSYSILDIQTIQSMNALAFSSSSSGPLATMATAPMSTNVGSGNTKSML